jgi:hypothetical protein
MGLSIHYSGCLTEPEFLPSLIDEIEDIVKVFGWRYHIFKRKFPEGAFGLQEYNKHIYGISFTPAKCETIPVCFLSNGRLSDTAHLEFFGKTDSQPENKYLYMLSVKTQYGGIEIHQFIIKFFRYLSKKYFSQFKFTDEGGYWESNDIEILKINFEKYQQLTDNFAGAIEKFPIQCDESIESYFERLMNQLKIQNKQK